MITKKSTKRLLIIVATLLLMVGCVFCTDVFAAGEEISIDFFTKIKNLYCNGLFYPLIGIALVLWGFFAKDQKKGDIFKNACIIIVGVFVALHLIGSLKVTIENIVGKYDSTSNISTEYTGDSTNY